MLLGTVLVLAGVFMLVDRVAEAPLLPRPLLRERSLRQGAIGSLLNTLTTSSTITLATLYLQNTRGLGPLTAAAVLLPFSLAVVAGGGGIGLSSVAATGLGTSVAESDRATAAGIINTSAQLGSALGIAMLLLIAAVTTGIPEHHSSVPAPAWILAAAVSLTAAVMFARARATAPRGTQTR